MYNKGPLDLVDLALNWASWSHKEFKAFKDMFEGQTL